MRTAMASLLTRPLAKLLRNRRPWELLKALNENVEKVNKIWNVSMRRELLQFLLQEQKTRPDGSRENDLRSAQDFAFTALKDELCVGGVYPRIFVKIKEVADIDNPSLFCKDLLTYIWDFIKTEADDAGPVSTPPIDFRDHTVEALKLLAEGQDYIANDIANSPRGVEVVFDLLQLPGHSQAFTYAAQMFIALSNSPDFVSSACEKQPKLVWKILKALCR